MGRLITELLIRVKFIVMELRITSFLKNIIYLDVLNYYGGILVLTYKPI
jgi:hypothetical protein